MATTKIRGGAKAVTVHTDGTGVAIKYGRDGISATIYLDYGEARELVEAIIEGASEADVISEGRHATGRRIS